MRRSTHPLLAGAALMFGACASSGGQMNMDDEAMGDAAMSDAPMAMMTHTYEVTLENLTRSQPFSPGVLVTHAPSVRLWGEGETSSPGLMAIAEDGNPEPAAMALQGMNGVGQVVTIGMPTHRMGGPAASTQRFRIDAPEGATHLSMAVMLICTNDGFTGLDGLELPRESQTVEAVAYDAGTERNTETFATLVDPCGAAGPVMAEEDGMNDRMATRDRVMEHEGIKGIGDLSSTTHGWSGPVARITVQRVDS